jgi:pimeloyl-ACP methyl ester carboxylesterase
VVLVHGGGWIVGDPSLMAPLARHLTENGFLTVNAAYQLADFDTPGFPAAVEDVACAVRYAAAHPDSDGTVAVVGHSAGAHIGSLVALTGDDYAGDCAYAGEGLPQRFVGLAGPYDVSRLGLAIVPFFGAGPDAIPDVWAAGNPQLLTDENTGLDSLIMYGELDGIVADSFAFDFHDALESSGSTSLLERVEGARHRDMDDPDFVGDLIVTWLER